MRSRKLAGHRTRPRRPTLAPKPREGEVDTKLRQLREELARVDEIIQALTPGGKPPKKPS